MRALRQQPLAVVPLLAAVTWAAGPAAAETGDERLELSFITDEADAVLLILDKRADALAATLAAWKRLDLGDAAARAFAYLPDNAVIRARVYPMIKPRSNSFVFEVDTDPAIFLYLDPEIDADNLENVIAHELHHIGLRSGCTEAELEGLSAAEREAVDWLGAFGEGLAMLAAAGSWDTHPHATTPDDERAAWERHVARSSPHDRV